MHWKSILLYSLGLLLFLFGNSELWEKLRAESLTKKQLQDSLRANKDAALKFDVQKVLFDSTSGKLVNQTPSFRTVHLKDEKKTVPEKKTVHKKKTKVHVETNHQPENASDTH